MIGGWVKAMTIAVLMVNPASARIPAHALCIDADNDGRGVGCPRGADADDSDPSTASTDDLLAWMKRNDYHPEVIYYVSPDGDDSLAAPNDPRRPYATIPAAMRRLRGGSCIVLREGQWQGDRLIAAYGLKAPKNRPAIVLAMPGERAVLKASSSCVEMRNCTNIVIDGPVLTTIAGGGHGVKINDCQRITLRNLEIFSLSRGIFGAQDINNLLIERCVVRDNGGSHGIYLGSRDRPNSNIVIRDCLVYRNAMHGIQHNGRIRQLVIEGNSVHSNTHGGLSMLQGVCGAMIRGNTVFNNNKQAVIFFCYDDKPNSGIIAYDQNDNIVEDNILWVGRYDWRKQTEQPAQHAAIEMRDGTAAQTIEMNNNVFRRNVIVTVQGAPAAFSRPSLAAGTTFIDNTFYRADGPQRVIDCRQQWHDITAAAGLCASFTGNVFARPNFADVSVTYSNTPELFDFSLPVQGGR